MDTDKSKDKDEIKVVEDPLVHSTEDYGKFKLFRKGLNRPINDRHVAALMKSFVDQPGLAHARPVIVNKDFEIMDGQHRYQAWKQLGLPIYYSVVDDTIDTARVLNKAQKNWTVRNYAESYATEGKQDYQTLIDYSDKYEMPVSLMAAILRGRRGVSMTGGGGIARIVRAGTFEIGDIQEADRFLTRLEDFAMFTDQWRHSNLVVAIDRVMSSKSYDHKRMIKKLESERLDANSKTIADNMRELERVYNSKLSGSERIETLF